MRIFISVDMEGATGVVHNDQLGPSGYDYERARKLLTGDVVAATTAALSLEDVTMVRICDGHGTMRNVLLEDLPDLCELISGPASSKALCQVEGLDDSFDAAMFVGYHARAGAPGAVLPHTWVGSLVHEIRVNGKVFGETALNAATAGAFGVPVVFITGDAAVCKEARADLGADLVTYAVKEARGPKAALCRPPVTTEAGIRLAVLTALAEGVTRKPFVVTEPVEVALVTHRREMADKAAKHGDVERTGDREVTLHADTWLDAAQRIWQVIEWTANQPPEWLQ